MVNVTVSLPDDVASRAAAAAADRGVTVEELASEALEVYLDKEPGSELPTLSFATLDRRHFSVVRPTHVQAFTLLP